MSDIDRCMIFALLWMILAAVVASEFLQFIAAATSAFWLLAAGVCLYRRWQAANEVD